MDLKLARVDGIRRMKYARVGGGVGLPHIRLGVSNMFGLPTETVYLAVGYLRACFVHNILRDVTKFEWK